MVAIFAEISSVGVCWKIASNTVVLYVGVMKVRDFLPQISPQNQINLLCDV